MINKERILSEIRRTAIENGGIPLGWRKFVNETGIRQSDWLGKFWPRWNDALREAGYSPNQLSTAYEVDELLEHYIALTRKLGVLPTSADMRMATRTDTSFPHSKPFERLGSKAELISKVLAYCRSKQGYEDIVRACEAYQPRPLAKEQEATSTEAFGEIYLIKAGRFYKIGRTNAVGRRERELAIQLPEKSTTIHVIRTDDPVGIEAYWHQRFETKRKNGEWFELSPQDIAAFKRRKFM